jgi:hypothetical protein
LTGRSFVLNYHESVDVPEIAEEWISGANLYVSEKLL